MNQTLTHYQRAVKQVLSQYEDFVTDHSTVALLFDDERRHYVAVRTGWRQHKHLHLCLVHMQIDGDTVIIHCNNTEDAVDTELVALGVPGERIRLAFLPPAHQAFVELPVNQRQLELV